ncbi:DUF6691 family protein [Oceanomicrobium pacificus]|uniref:YeeE/YedE family protein n=1 Tax=Oceanomicrobium pacificus TaxID=2692916 RepID=A0A6B0TNX4_9RHOB|nr:DUF6691 family protein [Oceanomicrobium pacificus]MXU64289.1 hypothetical protein [Oceanomicrobium pacificus]
MRLLISAFSGGLFGLGLMVSGMTDTTKVQGWLDIFGNWDPTLAFVLGGAIIPMFFAWRFAAKRETAVLGTPIPAMPDPKLGRNLTLGSFLFGMGWGLAGLCPGPAMASLSYGGWNGALFLVAMIAGMVAAVPVKSRLEAPV